MHNIKVIALDLDGTLLDSKKQLSEKNYNALCAAAEKGIEIVPTTGRFFGGMPEKIKSLPFLHYAITINGAQVYDIAKDKAVVKAEIPLNRALCLMRYFETLPEQVLYDCYMDNWGWITEELQNRASEFTCDNHYIKMMRELRTPVPELKAHLEKTGHDIQKISVYTMNAKLREELLYGLEKKFPDIAVSSSLIHNVEINNSHANKGEALHRFAEYLGCDISQTAAFGDGLNDLSMIKEAGLGVAMSNAHPDVKANADFISLSCDEDGVAHAIERFCL